MIWISRQRTIRNDRRIAAIVTMSMVSILTYQVANAWPSAIDDKYKKVDPSLYARYDEARNLLDKYSGESAFLELGQQRLLYVLRKDPKFSPAYMQLARLAIMADNDGNGSRGYEVAADLNRKAIDIEPRYADAWVLMGYIDAHLGKHNDAQAAFEKAEEIGTANPWLQINRAEEYLMTDRDSDALRTLDKIDIATMDNKKAQMSTAEMYVWYYKRADDLKNTETWYRRQLAIDPNYAWGYGNYAGFLVWYKGDFAEAEKQARAGLAIMDYGEGEETLAAALYASWASSPANARKQSIFNEAFSIDPDVLGMATKFEKYSATRNLADALRNAASTLRETASPPRDQVL